MKSYKKIITNFLSQNNELFENYTSYKDYNFRFKNLRNFKTVIIIGMGGSILGPKALYHFLKHKIKKKFIFIDNLDESHLTEIKKKNNLSKSLFLIISKSGNTNETILNLYFFKSYLKKNNTIIITENTNNFLRTLSKDKGFYFLEHKKYIGGRYSVLSDVGMLPAYLMGLNTKELKKGLKKLLMNRKYLINIFKEIKKLNIKKTKILILFNYVPELNHFLFWCQQLLAESLGKRRKGFIPVISNAPKDHHSLLQLYLDGPKDKIFYIFSSNKKNSIKTKSNFFGKSMKHLTNKNYNNIKLCQKKAFVKILKLNKIPTREIFINEFNESEIGKLFLLFIIEVIFLGNSMRINPFDQPAVENVKILTKKFLNSRKS